MLKNTSSYWTFVKEWANSPKRVASIFPSSPFIADALVDLAKVKESKVIVELGPGVGVVTEKILDKKDPASTFFAVEVSENLAKATRDRCPAAEVICGDAKHLEGMLLAKGLGSCDSIASCIPWATISCDIQDDILKAVSNSLEPGGRFATLLFAPGLLLPSTFRFVKKLEEMFGTLNISPVIWKNLPPAVVVWVEKS